MKQIWQNVCADGSIEVGAESIPSPSTIKEAFAEAVNNSENWEFVEWLQAKSAPYHCILRHGNELVDVIVYLKAVSNAGWETKPHCKRVQVSNLRQIAHLLKRRQSATKLNLIIGYYDFGGPLFVSWEAERYTGHETNRSCYVDADQLSKGYVQGRYVGECFGLPVAIFAPSAIGDFLLQQVQNAVESPAAFPPREAVASMARAFAATLVEASIIQNVWEGKSSITLMRDTGSSNWRQLEWPGFFFEEVATQILLASDFGVVKGLAKYGGSTIDLFCLIPWDLKAHAVGGPAVIPANDREAMKSAIDDYGYMGFVILMGDALFDDDGSFVTWHDNVKGGASRYSLEREARGAKSRKRKRAFIPRSIRIIVVDSAALAELPDFQEGMRNSNGKARRAKKRLHLNNLPKTAIVHEQTIALVDV